MYNLETSFEDFLKNEQEKYPELNVKDLEVLKERVESNKELPPIRDKLYIMFLHSCYFDVDAAYKAIVAYEKYRRDLPHVFAKYDPLSDSMKKVFETISMSEVTYTCSGKKKRFFYTNFKNVDPQQFDFVDSVRYFFMMLEYLIFTNGTFDGVVIAMNSKGIHWRHITKTPMGTMKRMIEFVQEALPVRLLEVHVLNAGSIISMLFNIIKPFMNRKLIDMLNVHTEGSEEVFKQLPIELYPLEIGGKGRSHYNYSEEIYEKLVSSRDWYLN